MLFWEGHMSKSCDQLKFNLFSNGIHLSVLVFYQKYVGSFAGAGVILKMSRGIFKYTRLP